jgi:DNA-directed RNA polymerase specialized sigma24 family protein
MAFRKLVIAPMSQSTGSKPPRHAGARSPAPFADETAQRRQGPVPRSGSARRAADRSRMSSRSRARSVLEANAQLDARTYFLVLENVASLFERDRAAQPPDIDTVIDIALRRAEAGRASVVSHDRYEAWVSVVCRNAYLNFIRSRRDHRPITDFDVIHDPRPSFDAAYDEYVVRKAILAAIGRLPRFLREVARLRFVDHCSHSAISRRTGRALPITRAYANKAAKRLRNDSLLRGTVGDWRE